MLSVETSLRHTSQTLNVFRCKECTQNFSREDHLRRHELSHSFPKFLCSHRGCGKRFHRDDVRKRHEGVHRPDPSKRRRRARRGILPRSRRRSTHSAFDDNTPSLSSDGLLSLGGASSIDSLLASVDWNMDGIWQGDEDDTVAQELVTQSLNLSMPAMPAPGAPETFLSQSPSDDDVRLCIEHFEISYLLRKPFIHSQTIGSSLVNRGLQLAMASLGALGMPGYSVLARTFYEDACRQLHASPDPDQLRHLQCQVLLIDFAIWIPDIALSQWALEEGQMAAMSIQALRKASPQCNVEQGWTEWIRNEEVKRTIFAFYTTFVPATIIFGYTSPLSSQNIDLDLPNPDTAWNADNEYDFQQAMLTNPAVYRLRGAFQLALHTLLSCDTTRDDSHETASVFGQYILLCGIAEAFDMAKKSPLNYSSATAFSTSLMSAFTPRTTFFKSLKTWKGLWWVSAECLWNKDRFALPQVESVLLLNHLYAALSSTCLEEQIGTRDSVAEAVEMLCSASKCGFFEVSQHGWKVFSPTARYHGTACASLTVHWLTALIARGAGTQLNEDDNELLRAVRQAVRRGLRETMNSVDDLESISNLRTHLLSLWGLMFGTTEWISNTLPGPIVVGICHSSSGY